MCSEFIENERIFKINHRKFKKIINSASYNCRSSSNDNTGLVKAISNKIPKGLFTDSIELGSFVSKDKKGKEQLLKTI